MIRVFNYPWSGKLGRVVTECLCCGTAEGSFQVSSHPTHCLTCYQQGKEPSPGRQLNYYDNLYHLTRQWCLEQGIDYEATVDAYRAQYGEISQENPTRVQQSGEDYTIYLSSKEST